jgi:hypothetical protein
LRKKEWLHSVSVPKNPLAEETHERKLIKIKLGLFDHPIPKYKENKIYPGTELRDDYKNWNISNEIDKKYVQNQFNKMYFYLINTIKFKIKKIKKNKKHHSKNKKRTETAKLKNSEREAELIRNYITPID